LIAVDHPEGWLNVIPEEAAMIAMSRLPWTGGLSKVAETLVALTPEVAVFVCTNWLRAGALQRPRHTAHTRRPVKVFKKVFIVLPLF
jgi:hypothetical protein